MSGVHDVYLGGALPAVLSVPAVHEGVLCLLCLICIILFPVYLLCVWRYIYCVWGVVPSVLCVLSLLRRDCCFWCVWCV